MGSAALPVPRFPDHTHLVPETAPGGCVGGVDHVGVAGPRTYVAAQQDAPQNRAMGIDGSLGSCSRLGGSW